MNYSLSKGDLNMGGVHYDTTVADLGRDCQVDGCENRAITRVSYNGYRADTCFRHGMMLFIGGTDEDAPPIRLKMPKPVKKRWWQTAMEAVFNRGK